MAGTPSPHPLDARDSSVKELWGKLDDVCRDVESIKKKFAEVEVIRHTVSTTHDTVKSEMNKMKEESAAVNKRIMAKMEKIHDYLTGEIDAARERPRSSKFEWQVKNFSKLKGEMRRAKLVILQRQLLRGHPWLQDVPRRSFQREERKGQGQPQRLRVHHQGPLHGPYDRTLQWPYMRCSTFVVVDQKTNMHHKMAEIGPEELGSKHEHCFQRPTDGHNEGIGFTALMPLEELEDLQKGYLINDSFLLHFITYDI
ncbi:hypothetical protein HPB48_020969 [Haemaphysalis longicornis]|uniref:TRAF1-6 MATH domain-containing protein n=1 Tax=Haemaphysalis longicornis TaxID=44386 RepID=A0A9J6FBP3_HAELO|nr:hypothetical protein HPB48_020969 [Haemaphysalis longicornis]